MERRHSREAAEHYVMAFVGGYLGFYGVLFRFGLLGTAQTNNLICLVQSILDGDGRDFLLRLGALALYAAAILLALRLSERAGVRLKLVSIGIDAAAVLLLGFLPAELDPLLGLYPIFFAAAFQWCSFPGLPGCSSATIFSTNNLRQFVTAAANFRRTRDRAYLHTCRFYGLTLCAFHLGVAACWGLGRLLGLRCVWLCFLPLTVAALITAAECRPRVEHT